MKTNTKEMRVCLTPLFKMWLVRLLDGNIISFYPLWNMSDVSSFIESTWQQISLDDTWSHYQEHQDQTSREKLHARVVFPFGQTAELRMKLTFHPRRSLLLSPNSNVWRKKKRKKVSKHLLQHLPSKHAELHQKKHWSCLCTCTNYNL